MYCVCCMYLFVAVSCVLVYNECSVMFVGVVVSTR